MREKIIFHKAGSWCQKGWGLLFGDSKPQGGSRPIKSWANKKLEQGTCIKGDGKTRLWLTAPRCNHKWRALNQSCGLWIKRRKIPLCLLLFLLMRETDGIYNILKKLWHGNAKVAFQCQHLRAIPWNYNLIKWPYGIWWCLYFTRAQNILSHWIETVTIANVKITEA